MPKIVYSLSAINTLLKKYKPSKICIVTSQTLSKKLAWAIREINFPDKKIITVPEGEKAKEWSAIGNLLKQFTVHNIDRNSIVIALGGGTVGDSVGFAASIYLRGIKYIQIPTTLLAQVDSAHGGKTGINFLNYKNQIGSTTLPLSTIIDHRFLVSISKEQVIDGLGEILKVGIIKDPSILSLLKKEHLTTILTSPNLEKIIKKSIAVKQSYVEQDIKDTHIRQMLNFGHTLGHAIELKYKISHGKAVIIGMLQELAVAESLKISPSSVRQNLVALLNSLGIKIDTDAYKADWQTILHDKKINGKKLYFPVVEKEGVSKLHNLDIGIFKRALTRQTK